MRADDDEDDDKETPAAKEKEEAGLVPSPIQNILFKARTVLLFGEISWKVAQSTVAQLLALSEEGKGDIRLFINSQGGHVESGDSIHDMIRFIGPKVKVIGTGWVASAGVHIFLAAKKENRFCLPNTRFMIHQPLGGAGGKASDIEIEAREILKMRERINRVIALETGQPIERVAKDTDRNFWMSAEEAKAYGVVTHIVDSVKDVK
ncbi:MAG: ATP-dependent Clp protease proteolytic subunit [Pseudomonadota bacterium]|nr:ATP-dependent Clp protease proteolytic subunit [Pseudomonadota bacterium]